MHSALTGVGLTGVALGLAYLAEALRYPWGTAARPGPGLYPVLVGILLALSSLGVSLEGRRHREDRGDVSWPRGSARWRVLAALGASLGYVTLLPYVGHPVAGALAIAIVLRTMGMRPWWLVGSAAVGMALGAYYLFGVLLGVRLPTGVWFP